MQSERAYPAINFKLISVLLQARLTILDGSRPQQHPLL